jgi:uncharacterized protein with von Willebrand factor type A (vWA) domain
MSRAVDGIPENGCLVSASCQTDKAKIEALGGWDKIMEGLKKRLAEKGRRQGAASGSALATPRLAHGPARLACASAKESRNNRAVRCGTVR